MKRWFTWLRTERAIDLGLLLVLLAFTVARGLLTIGAYPVLKITDEPAHFDNIQYRAEHHLRAPRPEGSKIDKIVSSTTSPELRRTWHATNELWRDSHIPNRFGVPAERDLEAMAGDRANRVTTGQNTSMGYPGVYYTVGALVYRAFYTDSVLARIYAVRVLSLIFGLLLVACTFCAARITVDSRPLAVAAALFAALQPLAAQQTIAVNSDAAVIGLAALAFCLQLLIVVRMPRPPLALMLTLAVVLAIVVETKPQAWGLVPGSAVLAIGFAARDPRARRTWLILAALLAAFFCTRGLCIALLDRSIFGSTVAQASSYAAMRALPLPSVVDFVPWLWERDDEFWSYLFKTGWADFCWLDVSLSAAWLSCIHLAALLLWIGLGAAVVRRVLAPDQRFFWQLAPGAFALGTAIAAFVFVLYLEYFANGAMKLERAIQGRSFLYALPPAAVVGIIALGSLVPRRFQGLVAALAVFGMMLLAAGSLLTVVGYEYVG